MPYGEILYVKGMDMSESENEDHVWDDRKLNMAYDTAVEIAKAEVAKRVAQATNSLNFGESTKKEECNHKKTKTTKESKKSNKTWHVGMHCRAIYKGDGLEYEAVITRIIGDKECLVTFLGYENTDVVPIDSLKPSRGKEERIEQIHQSLLDSIHEEQYSEKNENTDNCENPPDVSHNRSKKNKNRKNPKCDKINHSNMPFPLPNIPAMPSARNLGSSIGYADIPIAPPLPFPQEDPEDQAVSSMLVSWYMSGYYAGLYQGIKRTKRNQRNN